MTAPGFAGAGTAAGPPPVSALRLVRTPRWVARTALWMLRLLGAAPVALAFVPWQQTAVGIGRVVAYEPLERRQIVDAPVEGRIIKWHVIEGSRVKTGDLLVEITDNDPLFVERLEQERRAAQDKLKASDAQVYSLEDRLAAQESSRTFAVQAAAARVSEAGQRVRAAEHALDQAKAAFVAADKNVVRLRSLAEKGLRSQRDLELAELEYDRTKAETERARANLTGSIKQEDAARAEQRRIERDATASIEDTRSKRDKALAEAADAQASLTRIETRVARQETQTVRAPREGVVFRVLVQPGAQFVKSGESLLEIVPDATTRAVELWVKGVDLPLVREGRHVRLQFEGWPAVQFVGWPSVAVGTFGGVVQIVDPTDNGSGEFRLLVLHSPGDEPWPDNMYLRQGVRASGWVLLDTVPLGFELWRQLNGFPPTVKPDEKADDVEKGPKIPKAGAK